MICATKPSVTKFTLLSKNWPKNGQKMQIFAFFRPQMRIFCGRNVAYLKEREKLHYFMLEHLKIY